MSLYHAGVRVLNACLSVSLLAAGLPGCGDEGPRAWASKNAEFVEIRQVVVPVRSGGEETAGYLKRYKRKTSAGDVHWVEVYTPRDVQVGFVDESGRAWRWVGRDGRKGEWTDLGLMLLDAALPKLLGIEGAFEVRDVRTRFTEKGAR